MVQIAFMVMLCFFFALGYGILLWTGLSQHKRPPARITQITLYAIPICITGKYFVDTESAWFSMSELISVGIALFAYDYATKHRQS